MERTTGVGHATETPYAPTWAVLSRLFDAAHRPSTSRWTGSCGASATVPSASFCLLLAILAALPGVSVVAGALLVIPAW